VSAPSDPRQSAPNGAHPSTQEIPVAEPTTEGTVAPAPAVPQSAGPASAARPAVSLPAPGQQPAQPVRSAPAAEHGQPAPAWPDTLVDEPPADRTRQTPVPPVESAPPPRPAPSAAPATAPPAAPAAEGRPESGRPLAAPPIGEHPTVVQPAPQPPGHQDGVQPTGPVDFVPGLRIPDGTTPAASRGGSAGHAAAPGARPDRTALIGVGLAVLSAVLLQLGLFHGEPDLWTLTTLWSVFATLMSVLGLVALVLRVPAGSRVPAGTATRVSAGAVLGIAIFWLLVVLPIVAGDPGFLVTAALLALGAAVWVGPRGSR
jgi:hypothetical protein